MISFISNGNKISLSLNVHRPECNDAITLIIYNKSCQLTLVCIGHSHSEENKQKNPKMKKTLARQPIVPWPVSSWCCLLCSCTPNERTSTSGLTLPSCLLSRSPAAYSRQIWPPVMGSAFSLYILLFNPSKLEAARRALTILVIFLSPVHFLDNIWRGNVD